jgi:DNA gyrase subunit B
MVTLDNGESIRCTENHPFLMRDGTYQDAKNLQSGMSLMPLYRKQANIDTGKKTSSKYKYEQIYNPGTDDWKFTHRLVTPHCASGYVRHHVDFNRFNNSPENIVVMKWKDHQELHANHIRFYADRFAASGQKRKISTEVRAAWAKRGREHFLAYNVSAKHKADMQAYYTKEVREAHGARLRSYARSPENIERVTKINQTPERRAKAQKSLTAYNKSDKHRKTAADVGKKMFTRLWQDQDFIQKRARISSEIMKENWKKPEFQLKQKENTHKRYHHIKPNMDCLFCRSNNENTNHKVVSVVECGFEDVFDITVDNYANFALAAGVFVHNCEMLIDPWAANTVFKQDSNTTGTIYAFETADPVQDDRYGYQINGILVSDFVYPAWFEADFAPNSTQFDHQGVVTRPFQLMNGGYIGVFDVGPKTTGWTQRLTEGVPGPRTIHKSTQSRTKRRGIATLD